MTNRGEVLTCKNGRQWVYLGIWSRGYNGLPYHYFVQPQAGWIYTARKAETVKGMFEAWDGESAE